MGDLGPGPPKFGSVSLNSWGQLPQSRIVPDKIAVSLTTLTKAVVLNVMMSFTSDN